MSDKIQKLVGQNFSETDSDSVCDNNNSPPINYKNIFDDFPTPLWLINISEFEKEFPDLLKDKRLNKIIGANPELVPQILKKLKIENINKATLDLFKVDSINEFKENFEKFLPYFTYNKDKTDNSSFLNDFSIFQDKNGREFPVNLKWQRIENTSNLIVTLNEISQNSFPKNQNILEKIRCKTYFDNIQVGMTILKINEEKDDFIITDINPFSLKLENKSYSEIIGKKLTDVFPSVIESNLLSELIKTWETGQSREFLAKFSNSNGKVPKYLFNKNHIFKHGKNDIGVFYQDVTNEVLQNTKLFQSEEKFKSAFNSSLLLTSITSLKTGEIIDVNDAFIKNLGYKKNEIIGKGTNEINLWAKKEDRDKAINLLKSNGKIRNLEVEFLTKSGEKRFGIANAELVKLTNDTIILTMVEDITKTKKQANKIEILSKAVGYGKISIIVINKEGNIEFVNPYFTELTGYTYEESINRNLDFLRADFANEEYFKQIWKKILSGEEWTGEFKNKKKNGEIYWEQASISPIKNQNDEITHFIAIKVDITEYKNLQEQFYQAQKMEAIGRLAGGVAHDFNNLLTIINGYSDILKMKIPKDDKTYTFINEIKEAGIRASGLTRQLLTFSRKQTLEMKVTNLQFVINNMEKMLNRLIGEDIKLICEMPNNLKDVKVDVGQIEQVVMNLVVNARDAMPNGGEIKIYSQNCTFRKKESVCLTVEDSGLGISKENLLKIFDPFFTTKKEGKGTGLGLSVAFGIIKKHKGFLKVKSKLGEGTKFLIYLPATSNKAKEEQNSEENVNLTDKTKKQIFLIEDEPLVRKTIENCLESYNCEITTASSVKEANEKFSDRENQFDTILSDIVLPDGNGVDLVKNFHSIAPKSKIILMSGYTDERIRIDLIKKNKFAFLSKPIKLSKLLKEINSH